MKKIVCVICILLNSLSYSIEYASDELITQFIQEVKGKSLQIPFEIARDGIALEAEAINLKIQEFEDLLKHLPVEQGTHLMSPPQEVLKKLIGDLKLVKNDLQNFVVPQQGLYHVVDNIEQHLALQEKKLSYQSKLYKSIAQQTKSKSAYILAVRAQEKADALQHALSLIKSGKPIVQHHISDTIKDKAKKVFTDLQKQADTKINKEIESYKKEAGKKIDDAIDYVSKKVKELYDRYKNQLQPNE